MTEIVVNETFEANDSTFKQGETYDVSDSLAKTAIDKGYAQEIEDIDDTPNLTATNDSGRIEPVKSFFIGVSEKRNFRVKLMPPEFGKAEYDSPSILFQESRKDDAGNWSDETFFLPTGANLLAMSEALREAWKGVQELRD